LTSSLRDKALQTPCVDIWVSKQSDTLTDKRDAYFFEDPYDEKHKLEKDPVYTTQHGGKPRRLKLRGQKTGFMPEQSGKGCKD
jgi:hypothetical protein